jgi:hypothetical protein
VKIFHFQRRKLGKYFLFQLWMRGKKRSNELGKECPMDMNGLSTKVDLNIIPLGSYHFLICMDWFEKNDVVLQCYNKVFT